MHKAARCRAVEPVCESCRHHVILHHLTHFAPSAPSPASLSATAQRQIRPSQDPAVYRMQQEQNPEREGAQTSTFWRFDVMLEDQRRRLLRQLHCCTLPGQLPLVNFLVIFFEFAAMAMLMKSFNAFYTRRPVITTMITNAVLGGIADTVAQSITAVQARKARIDTVGKDESIYIEIRELDSKGSQLESGWVPTSKRLPSFDFERLARFMAHGFLIAIVQHRWYGFLKNTFPLTSKTATAAAFKRMACDQLIFAPMGLGVFFTFMTVTEGGGRRELTRKFRDIYIPSLKANYLVWPAVQMLNFRFVPIQFQIPLVSTVSIAWIAYLSLTNAAEDDKLAE